MPLRALSIRLTELAVTPHLLKGHTPREVVEFELAGVLNLLLSLAHLFNEFLLSSFCHLSVVKRCFVEDLSFADLRRGWPSK